LEKTMKHRKSKLQRRYGHAGIAKIVAAGVRHYSDNGQTRAWVAWVDSRGRKGETGGDPGGVHMQALLARAKREGAPFVKETW
jgi:hypothetical protein